MASQVGAVGILTLQFNYVKNKIIICNCSILADTDFYGDITIINMKNAKLDRE